MTVLLLLPVALSALLLAAHFLRSGNFLAVAGLLALIPLLTQRRLWVANVARLTLWLGTGVWLYSIVRFAAERVRLGEPWLRMALILGAVALATGLSSLVFSTRKLKAFYGAARAGAGESAADAAGADAPAASESQYEEVGA